MTDASVRKQVALLTAIINSIDDEIWFADPAGRFQLINPAGAHAFILTDAEPVDVERLAKSVEVLRADGTPRPLEEAPPIRALRGEVIKRQEEIVRIPATGELHFREVNSTPVRDESGRIVGAVSVVRDVSERKQALTKLQGSLEQLGLATDGAKIGLWYWAMPGEKLEWSDLCKATLDLPTGQEPTFEHFYSVVHPHDRKRVERLIAEAVEHRSDYEADYRIVRRDGTVRWVHAPGRVYTHADGSLRGMSGVLIDITEQKELQARIEAQSSQLVQLNRELQQRAEAAEVANRAKDAFLSVMSNELRTPLSSIMGMLYLAQSRVTDPKVASHLTKAKTASQHLLGILDSVLEVSQIEADGFSLAEEVFTLKNVVVALKEQFGQAALAKGLVFESSIDSELADLPLVGDPKRLAQILNMLVSNAIKFTPAGKIGLRAAAIERGAEELLLRFEIQDTGIGIGPEDQKCLFRPFQQVDMTLSRPFGGIGLGLYISKRLVERMGGEIGVVSAPGTGSTFWFSVRLPKLPDGVQPSTGTKDSRLQASTRTAGD